MFFEPDAPRCFSNVFGGESQEAEVCSNKIRIIILGIDERPIKISIVNNDHINALLLEPW